jgi:signal transduction histidine kinase
VFTNILGKKNDFRSAVASDSADSRMVGRMRLLLAVSALLAVLIDPAGVSSVEQSVWPVFLAYVIYSLAVYFSSQVWTTLIPSRLVHWMDAIWYALIMSMTGDVNSFFFLFFLFAILTASFRWGFEEGARITLFSVALFVACALRSSSDGDLPRLLLRTTFLLSIGYMCVFWGASKVVLNRQIALLRDVSRISNPRFGVDQTITAVLEKTRAFFGASSCMLVLQDDEHANSSLRTVGPETKKKELKPAALETELAERLMGTLGEKILAYSDPDRRALPFGQNAMLAFDTATVTWRRDDSQAGKILAEFLGSGSFISAPLPLRSGRGRIYVLSKKTDLRKADALFLNHIAEQSFPVIENIQLLDRMASEAALLERKRIAWNLHDTALQPYIGLNLGLGAIRSKGTQDNPLLPDIERLCAMTAEVISDLRNYAGKVSNEPGQSESILIVVLRQQASHIRHFYGIDIDISVTGDCTVSDRLAAEVLQIVREGLSNICRHSRARRGSVSLHCGPACLVIGIENENEARGEAFTDFTPRSISARAASLGGAAKVKRGQNGSTLVLVEIPT